jgi:hypothetical protein
MLMLRTAIPYSYVVLLLLALISLASSLWHPYIEHKKYPDECYDNVTSSLLPQYERSNWARRPMSLEFMQRYKLWPDLISKFDLIHGETMFGLEEAIEAVYKHQHPADCSKAKFLISGMYESGFGSELHVIGVGLATAMNLNRVYIMNPHRKMDSINHWQVDVPFCHKQGKHKLNRDCYFEPWSNCTIHDALGSRSIQDLRASNLHPEGYNKEVYDPKYFDEKTIIGELGPENDWDLPHALDLLMKCSPFPDNRIRYWWRAVSVAYLMRINEPTKQLIRHFKYNESSSMYFDKEKEQCVSVYARRGDKHLEMYILKNETIFFETAKELWNKMQPRLDPSQARPIMFVASEDATVVDSAIEWGKRNDWKILYTDLFDRRKVIAGYNMTERKWWHKTTPNHHHHLEYFSMILNIDSHIQCSAYICSMPSNFCRLIDELKATVAAKANTPLADFHDDSGIPCYTGHCITTGWR